VQKTGTWDSARERNAEKSSVRQCRKKVGYYLPFSIYYLYPRNGKVNGNKLNAIIFCSV